MALPSINGTTLPNVTNIARAPVRAGRSVVAKNGTRHWIGDATRLGHMVLDVTLENLTRAQADAVYALWYAPLSGAARTFLDGQGGSFQVQPEADSYNEQVDSIDNGVPRYTVNLRLYQAN